MRPPAYELAHWFYSSNLFAKKMWNEAIAIAEKLVELTAGSARALSVLGFAYGSAGMKDEAYKILEQLDSMAKDRCFGLIWRAYVWLGLGENKKALEDYEKAWQDTECPMVYSKAVPFAGCLCSEQKYQALLKKMNPDQ